MNDERNEKHERMLYGNECYVIQGAIFEVYREMGCGFLESIYQECMLLEITTRDIPFRAQPKLRLQYKSKELKQFYQPDLICFDKIIVELKAVKNLPQNIMHRLSTI